MTKEEMNNMSKDKSFTMSKNKQVCGSNKLQSLKGKNENDLDERKIVGVGH
jgi:hypothetical protein